MFAAKEFERYRFGLRWANKLMSKGGMSMESAKIKAYQLFVLIVLFEMGSAILIGLGAGAKQDAWITILLGLGGGLAVFLIYYQLYKYYQDIPLTSYVQKITGKWIGRLIGVSYIIYFI